MKSQALHELQNHISKIKKINNKCMFANLRRKLRQMIFRYPLVINKPNRLSYMNMSSAYQNIRKLMKNYLK